MKLHRLKYYLLMVSLMACMLQMHDALAVHPFSDDSNAIVAGRAKASAEQDVSAGNDLRNRLMRFNDENLPASFAIWINRSIRLTYESTLAFVLACLITYFMISTILIILVILINNIIRAVRSSKHRKLREFYQSNLIDFVFNQDLGAFANLACHRRKMGRTVLIDEIMKIQKDVNGETYKSLREIYLALQLDRKSIRKIMRRGWPEKISGIKEVAEMDIRSAMPIIGRYPASRNEVLRSEAQIGIVRLNTKDPFYFLDDFKEQLTRFEQLKIYNIVNRYEIPVPDFSRWFSSANDSVVIFVVNMAVLFNQGHSEKQLVKLLNHANPEVREAVISAIGAMELINYDLRLMEMYEQEMDNNKMAILKTLQRIPNERQIGFLARVTDEGNFDRQFEAVKALKNLGELGRIRLIKIDRERDENFKKIVRHVYDDRI